MIHGLGNEVLRHHCCNLCWLKQLLLRLSYTLRRKQLKVGNKSWSVRGTLQNALRQTALMPCGASSPLLLGDILPREDCSSLHHQRQGGLQTKGRISCFKGKACEEHTAARQRRDRNEVDGVDFTTQISCCDLHAAVCFAVQNVQQQIKIVLVGCELAAHSRRLSGLSPHSTCISCVLRNTNRLTRHMQTVFLHSLCGEPFQCKLVNLVATQRANLFLHSRYKGNMCTRE